MTEKYCPRKFNENTVDVAGIHGGCECEEEACAWWEEYTEMCSIKTLAFLRAIGAERANVTTTVKESNDE